MAGDPQHEAPPPFLVHRPPGVPGPLVISVPHAGRFYPPSLDRDRAVGWPTLHHLEDRYADRLIPHAVAQGAVAIVATHARAWIDLNRAAEDRIGSPISPHGRAGLGLIPQRLGGQALWRRTPRDAAIDARVEALHRPYHDAIATALVKARDRHGFAILIDCHSMPPIAGDAATRLVIGDRHGTSAAPRIVGRIADAARARGLHPARNRPYAGAYNLTRHGKPGEDIHAVQLEFDRSLYLDASLREPSENMGATAALLALLCEAAIACDRPQEYPLAAE